MKRIWHAIILLGWILLELVGLAFAAPVPVTFEWQASDQPRLRTHLFVKGPGGLIYLGEAAGKETRLTVPMEPGIYEVVAMSEWTRDFWGEVSESIGVVVTEPVPDWKLENGILTVNRPCKLRVSPKFSGALDRWRSYDSPETPFTRVKIESVSP